MADDQDNKRIDQMRRVNEAQKSHYNAIGTEGWSNDGNSWATNLWSKLRYRAMQGVSQDARQKVYAVHREWMGDVSGKKVLDLGAGAGSHLSPYLAKTAREYHAVELSGAQLAKLRTKSGNPPTARFIEGDFLDADVTDHDYDIIYAHAVLHHFRHLEDVLALMDAKLAPGGQIVSYDPSQVWLPMYLFRMLYRPFQTDADWEFPFSRSTMRLIENRFVAKGRLGVFARGKWALILGMVSPSLGKRYGDHLFLKDFKNAQDNRPVGSALHVSYNLQAKGD